MRIRDEKKIGSRISIPDPQHWKKERKKTPYHYYVIYVKQPNCKLCGGEGHVFVTEVDDFSLHQPGCSVSDPYSFFTDPDPDPEVEAGDQYGSGSNPEPGL
jgi:hypothetical protein